MASQVNSIPPLQTPPGILDLIREAREHPLTPIIGGLLNEHEICGLHGSPEAFKTVFSLQLAEAISTGRPFLGMWRIPNPKKVYFFETEMSVPALGSRLSTMFRSPNIPEKVSFASESELRQFKRTAGISAKLGLLAELITRAEADVVIIDTCNPFFRGKDSPNDETTVGAFLDGVSGLRAATKIFVRHNHKPRMDDFGGDGPSRIRGSGQFADVPDLLLELSRRDKRTHKAELEITKFRHGMKPDNLELWFDSQDLRLISIPPVIHLLQGGPQSRTELLQGLRTRFGIEQRLGDDLITAERPFVQDHQQGHNRVFEIDRDAARNAEWFPRVPDTPA
jgi:hypothetical protein